MKIPVSFKIGRRRYTVALHANSYKERGFLIPAGKRMVIFNNTRGVPRSDEDKAETFWHETTHAILYEMKHPLWDDEPFVVAFSKRLTQVCLTADLGA